MRFDCSLKKYFEVQQKSLTEEDLSRYIDNNSIEEFFIKVFKKSLNENVLQTDENLILKIFRCFICSSFISNYFSCHNHCYYRQIS